ncbi:hypothetical protein BG53_09390 [Paenibacillus darwinianus]|uniref:ATP-grasp domain-containing protein n=1 Tax=Paenibacillus darwinianus TaxID=1380763 RepID=A0A9W5S3M5_9BACL|nr:YheC/YheD family protein [Paenibacillus darwinianus]EXX91591.1 hypothetical protein CH50_13335 [Paenibacillus darwinianus]EXX91735.1 hypothetical protein BG53_09390 [Paenibacillus darwinianus]EXX92452.1 hypothetical protein BG52_12660 [Paenibacillus darwinianus]
MQKKKIPVQIISSGILSDDALLVGETLVKKWKIPQGQPVTIKFGSFRSTVKIIPVQRFEGLRISYGLARRMGLLTNTNLRLKYGAASSVLALGPLIGVMISRDHPQMADRPFGAITQFCKELVDASELQGAYVYFFTPDQIGAKEGAVDAWVYAEGWKQQQMPVPDIVNNRLTTRKLENKPSVQQFMREAKARYGTQVFNEKFLDKSEVFEALQRDASLHRLLPESHLLRGYTQLKAMCSRYSSVFLKPVRGSLGKGIIKISRQLPGAYTALYATAGGTRRQQYESLPKLFSALSGKISSVRYQIQQGLQLIEIGGRPVDFRALVQKNATGKWAVTSIVARIAGGQHFVSNLARGGTLIHVKEAILKSNMIASAKQGASARLHAAAVDIAAGIETQIPAHFGELGIDLAMDAGGRVWLLEVNAKPSKNDNTPLTANSIRPSVRIMMQYARFLSGF